MKIICDFSVFYLDETLPKGSIVVECGNALLKKGYKLKIFNTINFSKSMHYNPMSYIHSEKDILKLVTALMTNTKGEGQGGDPFWDKAERLLLVSLIAYLHYEAPAEEQNFATLLEMLNTMQVSEDDETYQNPVDLLFEDLGKKKPNSFAIRQYKLYKLAAGKTAKSILISCGARLSPFDIQEIRDATMYDELELDKLGDRKTALFLIMSDTDSTVAEAGVVIMTANTRIKTNTVDDLLCVQPLHLSIGVQFIEIGHAQCQISICKKFDSFCFSEAHEQGINVFFDCAFLQEFCKGVRSLHQSSIFHIGADNDARRIQVIIESLALAQELRAKDDVVTVELFARRCRVANRNGALNNHDGFRVILNHQLDDRFDCTGVEEILFTIVICRCSNDHEICIGVCFLCIQSCSQIQLFFCQILLKVFVLNRRFLVINQLNLFRDNIHSRNMMMLRQKSCNRKSYIACSSNGNLQILKISHN